MMKNTNLEKVPHLFIRLKIIHLSKQTVLGLKKDRQYVKSNITVNFNGSFIALYIFQSTFFQCVAID